MLKLLPTLIFLTITFSSCLSLSDGSTVLIKESPNERHTKKAILFLRQFGATVSDSYQVSVADYESKFDTTQVGNAFTVDTNQSDTGLDSTSINFSWLSDDSLQIEYDKKLRTFVRQTSADGVTIACKAKMINLAIKVFCQMKAIQLHLSFLSFTATFELTEH